MYKKRGNWAGNEQTVSRVSASRAFAPQQTRRNRAAHAGEQHKENAHHNQARNHHDDQAVRSQKVIEHLLGLGVRIACLLAVYGLNHGITCFILAVGQCDLRGGEK